MTYPLATPMRAGLMTPAHAQFVEAGVLFCGLAGGTSSALTVSTGKSLTGLMLNQIIGLKTGASANAGAATLNVDGLGAKAITRNGAALVGGELAANTDIWLQYDGSGWRIIAGKSAGGISDIASITSATTVTAASYGTLIDCTGGAYTLSLAAAATMGKGSFAVRNSNVTGNIVIDPNGSETIDGGATLTVTPGKSAIVVCDGTKFNTIGFNTSASSATFNASDKSANVALSNANMTATGSGTGIVRGTPAIPAGKWVFGFRINSVVAAGGAGIATSSASLSGYLGQDANGWAYDTSGNLAHNAATTAFGGALSAGDVLYVYINTTTGKIWFARNGVMLGSGDPAADANPAYSGLSGTLYVACGPGNGTAMTLLASAADLPYAVVSGFAPLP